MASAKGGQCQMEWSMGRGVPSAADYGDWGSVMSSPSAPTENGFWRILKATERSFLYLYDKNLRGTICISVPLLQFLGDLSRASSVICTPMNRMHNHSLFHYGRFASLEQKYATDILSQDSYYIVMTNNLVFRYCK